MNKEKETYLKSIYFDPAHPASYTGVDKLHRFVKDEKKYNISRGLVKRWLSAQQTYTNHRQVRRNFKRRRVIVSTKHMQWDGDTINMVRYEKANDGFRYILLLIDILSRFVWTVPLKNLKGNVMITALRKIFDKIKPKKLRTDMGSEFRNKYVKTYLDGEGVGYFNTTNETKANFSERGIKTLKSKLTRYMTEKQTHRWVDVLSDMTDSYNKTYHRSINMTPYQAQDVADPILWQIQYDPKLKPVKRERIKPPKRKNPFKFKIDSKVKLSHLRGKFDKEYDHKWTEEIFTVIERDIKQSIPIYKIKSWDNEPVIGSFYTQELQSVVPPEDGVYNIEQVLKKRKRGGKSQMLVKWQGWGSRFNSWVDEAEVRDI